MPRGGKREGSGRKKNKPDSPKTYIQKQARQYGEKALAALVGNLADDNGNIRNQAARTILEYGYGKPTQEITGADGAPVFEGAVLEVVQAKNKDS